MNIFIAVGKGLHLKPCVTGIGCQGADHMACVRRLDVGIAAAQRAATGPFS